MYYLVVWVCGWAVFWLKFYVNIIEISKYCWFYFSGLLNTTWVGNGLLLLFFTTFLVGYFYRLSVVVCYLVCLSYLDSIVMSSITPNLWVGFSTLHPSLLYICLVGIWFIFYAQSNLQITVSVWHYFLAILISFAAGNLWALQFDGSMLLWFSDFVEWLFLYLFFSLLLYTHMYLLPMFSITSCYHIIFSMCGFIFLRLGLIPSQHNFFSEIDLHSYWGIYIGLLLTYCTPSTRHSGVSISYSPVYALSCYNLVLFWWVTGVMYYFYKLRSVFVMRLTVLTLWQHTLVLIFMCSWVLSSLNVHYVYTVDTHVQLLNNHMLYNNFWYFDTIYYSSKCPNQIHSNFNSYNLFLETYSQSSSNLKLYSTNYSYIFLWWLL